MAIGKKTGGRDFLPGNTPLGHRHHIPEEIKEARKLTKIEFEEIMNRHLHSTLPELNKVITSPSTPVIEALVCRILHEALKTGDQARLGFFVDRLLGKPVEQIKVETDITVRLVTIGPKEAQTVLSSDPFKAVDAEFINVPQLEE